MAGLGSYQTVKALAKKAWAYEREVLLLSIPNLIQAKRAAGRPKDLLLIPELESLLEAQEASERDQT